VRGRTLTNVLLESMESWRAQGFQRFFLVDGLSANTAAVDEAALRFSAQGRGSVRVLRWQADPEVRALVAKRLNATEPGRCEYGLLCLSAHVDPGLLHAPAGIVERASGSASDYASWRKRGRDPRRFRKLFPRAQVLAESVGPDAAFGATLFAVIVERFASIVAQASA
jgi:creatinine amidohydrolase/Fe(II)-dependent formamide hydrolase-like protein